MAKLAVISKTKTDQQLCNFRLKHTVFTHYCQGEPKCACCGEHRIVFLSIDHIGGGGSAHRKEIGNSGGMRMYRWLKKNGYPSGFRVLCHNCNQCLGHYGYCPHQIERGEIDPSIGPVLQKTVTEKTRDKILAAAILVFGRGQYPSISRIATETGSYSPAMIIKHRTALLKDGLWPCGVWYKRPRRGETI